MPDCDTISPANVDASDQLDPTLPRPVDSGDFLAARALVQPIFGPPSHAGEVGTFGRYRVLKKLGQGGMGAVYLGYDATLDRKVALKVMLPQYAVQPEAHDRFLREARSAAAVKSDHVVTIFDVGEVSGIPFIALEYLLGAPLDQFLKAKGDLPPDQVIRIGRETALGLAAAHDLELIHRDIKPGNVWLEAPNGRVKILDFGLARTQNDDTHLTGSGMIVGTPSFMSPEQGRGQKLDGRSDLFSLGTVLYRLATGRLPFDDSSTMAALTSLAVDTPPPPRAVNPNVPPGLDAIITKLLAKNPDARFQSALEVAEALRTAEQSAFGPAVVPLALSVEPHGQADVWSGIDSDATDLTAVPVVAPSAVRRVAREPGPSVRFLVLSVAVLLITGALLTTLFVRQSKMPQATESDDARARGARVEPPAPPKPVPPKPAPDRSPDRRAAEYVLNLGGAITPTDPEIELRKIGDLPKEPFTIRGVSAGNINITDAGLEVFKECTEVTGLDLNNSPATDAGLAHFKNYKKLVALNLAGAQIRGTGLVHFKGCAELMRLNLSHLPLNDDALSAFADCPKLRHVSLTNTKSTDAGVALFKDCSELVELSLADTRVTDEALVHARGWPGLQMLFLDNTAITDAGLEHLRGCKVLLHLNLSGTQITDAGLEHLRKCKWLTELNLRGTRVTSQAVTKFAEALPRCRIEHGGTIEPKK